MPDLYFRGSGDTLLVGTSYAIIDVLDNNWVIHGLPGRGGLWTQLAKDRER